MKKTLFLIIGAFSLVFVILILALIGLQSNNKRLSQVNIEYEYYLNKPIYGTELATLINKAIDNNKKMGVQKNQKGFYIDNGRDSIIITIQMLGSKEIYEMEKIFASRNRIFCRTI